MKYCIECGNELKASAQFCPKCGTKQTVAQVNQPETVQERPIHSAPTSPYQQATNQPTNSGASITVTVPGVEIKDTQAKAKNYFMKLFEVAKFPSFNYGTDSTFAYATQFLLAFSKIFVIYALSKASINMFGLALSGYGGIDDLFNGILGGFGANEMIKSMILKLFIALLVYSAVRILTTWLLAKHWLGNDVTYTDVTSSYSNLMAGLVLGYFLIGVLFAVGIFFSILSVISLFIFMFIEYFVVPILVLNKYYHNKKISIVYLDKVHIIV
ncbi:zinc ribbon domain-containing protein [Atopobacter phocae]|uniref:zinc ribbon domain-containing protein n=1 Tax=Atopobacter phocae TaxID=136492 RepID=UPI000471C6DC|nr:zinc ribbon domain-containing protein [Atopobacter phocae]